jgi:flavin reductase (DIM6/NTAB) family NADH-FMN oxidoreductase RutF
MIRTDLAATATPAAVRGFMRKWATGVAVVTSCSAGTPVGCTVNAFTSVSLCPPLLLVSLAQRSHTLAAATAWGAFGVNLLTWRQRHLAEQFAGAASDRFCGVEHRLWRGVPVLDGALGVAVCTVEQIIPVADHALLLGSPQWCDDRAEAAQLDGHDAAPAVFFGGGYRRADP